MSSRRIARHDDGIADPLVALARADPLSPFYDPRYARPLSSTPPDGWGEIDTALLEETRAAVPAFPVDLLPTFWRDWVLDTANATGAPADYVAQSLFAAVGGLCGAGVVVRLGPRWDEPLVLWQALVGPPSSGKSPAMAPMRELLGRLDAERDDDAKGALVTEVSLSAVADAVTANPRGVVLWRDDPADVVAHRCRARAVAAGLVGADGVVRARQGPAPHRPLRCKPAARLPAAPSRRPSGGGPGVRVARAVRLA